MKIKNKYIKKIITSGLIGSLLLGSIPFNSFANINKINNDISVTNTESESAEEISPQMLAVIASLAVASGITISDNNDLYDIGRMFHDYVKSHSDITWNIIKSTFNNSVSVLNNGLVSIDSELLDIAKGFFDDTFNSSSDIYLGDYTSLSNLKFDRSSVPRTVYVNDKIRIIFHSFSLSRYGLYLNYTCEYLIEDSWSSKRAGSFNCDSYGKGSYPPFPDDLLDGEYVYTYLDGSMIYFTVNGRNIPKDYLGSLSIPDFVEYATSWGVSVSSYTFSYNGGYTWDNVENKKENESISLSIPSNLSQLVGQSSDDFWNNRDNLINPCTQEIILPEVENPSINIGESVKLQTEANCSIYNAEELVTKAEESKDITDIENARNEVNKLPEGQDKQDLQNRLDAITPNITLSSNSVTANLDVYIKSENSLVMTLDSNSITFDGFSSVEDMVKENTVTVTIKSSLPYELNSYLVQEITSLDDEPKTLDKSILNIKANGTDTYNTFEDIGTTPILLLDNQSPGEVNNHGIDFMLDADVPYENGNYKTVIKFEAKQK